MGLITGPGKLRLGDLRSVVSMSLCECSDVCNSWRERYLAGGGPHASVMSAVAELPDCRDVIPMPATSSAEAADVAGDVGDSAEDADFDGVSEVQCNLEVRRQRILGPLGTSARPELVYAACEDAIGVVSGAVARRSHQGRSSGPALLTPGRLHGQVYASSMSDCWSGC